MNASPAMDTGAPLLVLGAEVELQSHERLAHASRSASCGPAPAAPRPQDGELLRGRPPARAAGTLRAAPTCGSSTAGRWRSPSSALPPSSRSTAMATSRPVDRAHGRRARRSSLAERGGRHRRQAGRRGDARGGRRRRQRARPRRSATCAPASATAATCVGVMARRAVEAAAAARPRRDDPRPRQPRLGIGAPLGG